jgi:hypothetical protein
MAGHAGSSPLIRKATIQRFPYVIAFEEHERHVLAGRRTRQNRPLYWLTRAKP